MSKSFHWYKADGTPCYEVPYKDPSKGMRSCTMADARKLKLLPSVTTICNVLDKPALTEWKIRNAIEATLTTPRNDGESLDDFASRVLAVDTESISDAAKQLGIDVHDGIEAVINAAKVADELLPFINPVMEVLQCFGKPLSTEKILVGDGYAGKTDLISQGNVIMVWDFKTTKAAKLPTKSYTEHRLQLAAYAAALGNTGDVPIRTSNIYISTVRPGEISVCENHLWQYDFEMFKKVRDLWYWQNSYEL